MIKSSILQYLRTMLRYPSQVSPSSRYYFIYKLDSFFTSFSLSAQSLSAISGFVACSAASTI